MSAQNRVMFVDDEDGVRLSYDRYFSGQGFDVETAENGANAISNLESRPVDVVVADLKMPVMNGIQLLEWIHDEQPDTRFILLTGYGNEEVERRVRELGAYEYLNKPINPHTLAAVVTAAMHLPVPEAAAPAPAETMPAVEARTVVAPTGMVATVRRVLEWVAELVEPAPNQAAIDEAVKVKGTMRRTMEVSAGLILAPLLGLAFVISLPVIGFGALLWTIATSVRNHRRPANS